MTKNKTKPKKSDYGDMLEKIFSEEYISLLKNINADKKQDFELANSIIICNCRKSFTALLFWTLPIRKVVCPSDEVLQEPRDFILQILYSR